jgi:hypothetical protein|tara:strand:- start:233 stop:508 length:276 start_codon:yes stop_codon:yes gene_type:complete
MTKEQTVPKWFDGEVYDKGDVVVNRWSGAECELNALELSIYDMIMGAQLAIDLKYNGDMLDPKTAYFQREMRKGLDWFRENNAEAYMILLD